MMESTRSQPPVAVVVVMMMVMGGGGRVRSLQPATSGWLGTREEGEVVTCDKGVLCVRADKNQSGVLPYLWGDSAVKHTSTHLGGRAARYHSERTRYLTVTPYYLWLLGPNDRAHHQALRVLWPPIWRGLFSVDFKFMTCMLKVFLYSSPPVRGEHR